MAEPQSPPGRLTRRARGLTAVAVAAVAAVNLAGIWDIALARRGAAEEAARAFAVDTAARARALEQTLADMQANLTFLAASSSVARLTGEADTAPARALREAAESALLVSLRSHPSVVRLAVMAPGGVPLLLVGRRGGVPVLWVSGAPTGSEGAATAPDRPRLSAVLPPGGGDANRLEVEVAPALLLGRTDADGRRCALRDASGRPLAQPAGPRTPDPAASSEPLLEAAAPVRADGWSMPGPWTLTCTEPERLAVAFTEPRASRQRTTLALNLGGMALAVLLGGLALREARRRERMEAAAHEEARVRELERQLFHAERLTTVGQLAAGIAHEINNPLEGMANYLTLAQEALGRGDTAAAEQRLRGVRQGLDQAAGTVRQVLTQSEAGASARSAVDVNRILADTVEFIRSRREFAAIRFGLDLAEGPLPTLGNAIMLGQVASNLLLNACEAQPAGGAVDVSTRRSGATVVVDVADRGPGVPEADRFRVFEPFFSTKQSSGLGLSVCHAIARQHEGDLKVLAREGGGAVFRMTLPVLEGGAS
jgi:signal transduction histidine kinase